MAPVVLDKSECVTVTLQSVHVFIPRDPQNKKKQAGQ